MEVRGQVLTKITVYPRVTNPATNQQKPLRRVLTRCILRNEQNTIARSSGVVLSASTFAQCFDEPHIEYLDWAEWVLMSQCVTADDIEQVMSRYWSVQTGTNTNTIIVDGETEVETDWATSASITTWENVNFITASTKIPNAALRVQSIQDNRRGSERVSHILLRG